LTFCFSVKELDGFKFDMLLMSPPCQPFTRLGMKKDMEDPRTKSVEACVCVCLNLKM